MAIKKITFVGEDSKLEVGMIVYWGKIHETEIHLCDEVPQNIGFFKEKKELKKALSKMAKEELILPIRIKICERK